MSYGASEFVEYDIPLPLEYQEHAYSVCEEYGVDYETVLAIMWHESRFIVDVSDHVNANGSLDRGLMQINSCNWSWLQGMGLDVSNPYDNIESGVVMLARLQDKGYDQEDTLAAYAAGEGGMRRGGGYSFARKILALSADGTFAA